jgi:hypothetical protein
VREGDNCFTFFEPVRGPDEIAVPREKLDLARLEPAKRGNLYHAAGGSDLMALYAFRAGTPASRSKSAIASGAIMTQLVRDRLARQKLESEAHRHGRPRGTRR